MQEIELYCTCRDLWLWWHGAVWCLRKVFIAY